MHSTYFELYRMRTDRHGLHQKLVASARAHGIKAAAREFGCSRNTVRKWWRRDQPGKPSALVERSRRPKRSPNQIPKGLEGQIVKLRRQTGFGAERLQREFRLPCGLNAIAHYWPPMTHLKLPRFQYTVREPVSGACFTGYADERSKSYATLRLNNSRCIWPVMAWISPVWSGKPTTAVSS